MNAFGVKYQYYFISLIFIQASEHWENRVNLSMHVNLSQAPKFTFLQQIASWFSKQQQKSFPRRCYKVLHLYYIRSPYIVLAKNSIQCSRPGFESKLLSNCIHVGTIREGQTTKTCKHGTGLQYLNQFMNNCLQNNGIKQA